MDKFAKTKAANEMKKKQDKAKLEKKYISNNPFECLKFFKDIDEPYHRFQYATSAVFFPHPETVEIDFKDGRITETLTFPGNVEDATIEIKPNILLDLMECLYTED